MYIKETVKTSRSSNLELLRIISIMLIITSHYSVHGIININSVSFSLNKILLQATPFGANVGVYIFFLISGYFLVGTNFSINKLVRLCLKISICSILALVVYVIVNGGETINLETIIESLLPVITGSYWFASSYFLMYILLPFLNLLIKSLNCRTHLYLIIVLFLLYNIIPTFTTFDTFFFTPYLSIYCFIVAAFIKLYTNKYFENTKANLILAVTTFFLYLISILCFNFISSKIIFIKQHALYFSSKDSVLVFLCAVAVFNLFLNWNIKFNKVINFFASATFSIYLIHDNNLIRTLLWTKLIDNSAFFYTSLLPAHLILSVIIIFAVCVIADKIVISFIEAFIWRRIEKHLSKFISFKQKLDTILESLCKS